MPLAPRHRQAITNLDDALLWAFDDTRRAFAESREQMTCHLLYPVLGSETLAIATVIAPGGIDDPAPILRAARALAVGVNPVAAIWVVPGLEPDGPIWLTLEQDGFRERTWYAKPTVGSPDDLGEFVDNSGDKALIGEDGYFALPSNVEAFGERNPQGLFPPDPDEIERARRSQARITQIAAVIA